MFDDFDVATLASIVLGLGDLMWLAHDIHRNGFSTMYTIIGFTFLMGNVFLALALRQHSHTKK